VVSTKQLGSVPVNSIKIPNEDFALTLRSALEDSFTKVSEEFQISTEEAELTVLAKELGIIQYYLLQLEKLIDE
jgi:hypothetical protein